MLTILLFVSLVLPCLLVLLAGGAWVYGYFNSEKVLEANSLEKHFNKISHISDIAVLIASHNGEDNISRTVKSALQNGCQVFVVSDGSTDSTDILARDAGAKVLKLIDNVGKPAALNIAYKHFKLSAKFRAVAILDDDVVVESDFIAQALRLMDEYTAIVVGKNLTLWPDSHKWNIWLAKRSYSYWSYQLTIRRLQSHFGVMNCISGSNSVYRTELLDKVLSTPPPYIVDDTFWVLETQRRQLGRIVYAPKARAHLQDPTNFKDWYKQNVRWLWGTFQGVIGHRVGRQWSRFDLAYILLILQWIFYVILAPISLWLIYSNGLIWWSIAFYSLWVIAASLQLGKLRLVLFMPAILIIDLVYRIIFVHALFKAIGQPTVDNCVWESPRRLTINR